jgi:hypothetical protein
MLASQFLPAQVPAQQSVGLFKAGEAWFVHALMGISTHIIISCVFLDL